MNLFYNLPLDLQRKIYEYEGHSVEKYKLVINEIKYNYMINLFFDLPIELQREIYKYEGSYQEKYKLVINEINYNYFLYTRLFDRINKKYSFYKWYQKNYIL